jgi:hypothetical protein
MARTAADIQAEIDSIRANLAKGILRVKHGETDITYNSPSEMRKVLDDLLAELAGVQSSPVRQVRFRTTKGFDT